jgi:hypothetical protein
MLLCYQFFVGSLCCFVLVLRADRRYNLGGQDLLESVGFGNIPAFNSYNLPKGPLRSVTAIVEDQST